MNKEFMIHPCLRGLSAKGCGRQDKQLNTYDYFADIPGNNDACDLVEVQFKHTRKGYYRNENRIPLQKGDIVAVEASPGHDIGVVTLTGQLVPLQMKKACLRPDTEIKRIYRKARPVDMEKYEEAQSREHGTMIQARQIAKDLNLDMKIGDVEYQGDCNKAIFYYIADQRVDFRQLIKVLAETFHVRIEMRQIGARQEAGRIGGIGACGRELCCASWISSFSSVTTNAARVQDISLNPLKLAGQCSKLKCCLMYEYDVYADARQTLPRVREPLQAMDGEYYLVKTDILGRMMSFSTSKDTMANVVTIPTSRVREIVAMNRAGKKVESIVDANSAAAVEEPTFRTEEDSITRFDKQNRRRKGRGDRRDRGQRQGRAEERAVTPQNGEKGNGEGEHHQRQDRPQRRSNDRRGRDNRHRGNRNGGGESNGGQNSTPKQE